MPSWTYGVCAAAVAATTLTACDTRCAFRIVARIDSGAGTVGCCGGHAVEDVVVPDERDVAVDLIDRVSSGRAGGHELWLTGPTCDRLFEGPYPAPGDGPRPTPRCPVLLGPVEPGRLSPRAPLAPGRYRVFVQAYDSNPSPSEYRFDVSIWALSCGSSPVAP